MLGHRDPKTTMVYVGHDADEEDRVLERFAGGALTLEQDAAAA
jgi:integrase